MSTKYTSVGTRKQWQCAKILLSKIITDYYLPLCIFTENLKRHMLKHEIRMTSL